MSIFLVNWKKQSQYFRIQKKNKFVFIHIPKMAGTSIKNAIEKSKFRDSFIYKGHSFPIHKLSKKENNYRIFSSVRNPLAWYVSLYNFKINADYINSPLKDYSIMPNNSFNDFFDDVVMMNNGIEGLMKWYKPYKKYNRELFNFENEQLGCLTLQFIYYCFEDWSEILKYKNIHSLIINNFKELISVDRVLKVENLQSDFNEMVSNTSIRITFKKDNVTPHSPYMDMYSDYMVKSIRERDNCIFELFNY